MMELLAKSDHYDPISLKKHLYWVDHCARLMADQFGFDKDLVSKGALLHDLGKGHPRFQQQIREERLRASERDKSFRHEISSLGFLPLFPEEEWQELTEMVIAHHRGLKGKKGLLTLDENGEDWLSYHLKDWEDWSPPVMKLLQGLGGPQERAIPHEEAVSALKWVFEYCHSIPRGWSEWRGILMAADHMASAFHEEVKEVEPKLFKVPDISPFKREHPLYPLSQKSAEDERPHTLTVAPTGAGKTDFLIRRCRGRAFYTLPFQASINAMAEKFRDMLGKDEHDIRVLHSASRATDEGADEKEVELQPFTGASVKVMTPYQLASVLFNLPGFEAQILDIKGNDVLFDEVHTYSDVGQAITLHLIELCAKLGCRVHIGTATMPTALYQEILDRLGGEEMVYEKQLSSEELATYDRHYVEKENEEEAAIKKVSDACQDGEKVLMVANTVKTAQAWYEEIEEALPNVPKMLLHSRFRRMDRDEREKRLKQEFDGQEGPCVVVSTQVVEVSLDLDFDRMLTQAAPIDSLVQRFGRVNRTRKPAEERVLKSVHVLEPGEKTLPYGKEVVRSSFEALPEGRLPEVDLQSLIDRVYPSLDLSRIEGQLFWENGELSLAKLHDISKANYLEMLDIDSVPCILPEDQEAYTEGDFVTRTKLEIPYHYKSLYSFGQELHQLDRGKQPYVLPPLPEYEKYGAVPQKEDVFL